MKNWMIASCHKAKFEVASIGNQGVGWTTFVQRVNGTKKWHVSDEAHGISRVGATCVACDAVAKKVRRSATATEQFSKVRRKIVKNVEFC